ncbi:hypothetical protein [Sphingomonas sp. 3-13AW]|uniref:hypothetical protein n=1 Tax=Sphingomonas sp. 3-13AW TaxID=3050450 RepID=UPI003BB5A4F8
MPASAYRHGLLNIADLQGKGEDTRYLVHRLAAAAGVDPTTVQIEVEELLDL